MNLVEALRDSKETGRTYVRASDLGSGWLKWYEPWEYKFSNDDILADDWIPLREKPPDP